MTRRFQVHPERHLVLPTGLMPVDGQPNMRLEPGRVVTIPASQCQTMQRFIAGRLNAGDLVELGPDDVPAALPEPVVVAAAVVVTPLPAPGMTLADRKDA